MGYGDYPVLKSGLTAQELVGEKESADRETRYPAGFVGMIRLALDSTDPVLAAVTSLGRFGFSEDSTGNTIIEDRYDFSKAGKKKDDSYSQLRNSLGPANGNGFSIKANLGPIGELGTL